MARFFFRPDYATGMGALILLLISMLSCSSQRWAASSPVNMQEQSVTESLKVRISGETRRFLNELQKEQKGQEPFTPSQQLISKYGLQKIDTFFYLRGMIKVQEHFDPAGLIKAGIIAGPPAGNIVTVQVPVHRFVAFLQQEGIDYFEISGRAQPH